MITSVQNERVKEWQKLHRKKGRSRANRFLVEGFHLVEEACQSNYEVIEIIIKNNLPVPTYCAQYPITYVSEQVFSHLSQTVAPQGIAAVLSMKHSKQFASNNILLIDAVQDPGNLGTIIRTADAAGFSSVILGEGTVDIYNDKVIRATQGSLFHVTIIQETLLKMIKKLKEEGFQILATGLDDATLYTNVQPKEKTALILGNEGAGIEESILQAADAIVKIPIYGKAESLNVSIAAGILMYYIKR